MIREVREEVGIEVNVEKLLYATTFKTNPERQVVILTYRCKAMTTEISLSSEHTDYRWASKEEFRELLFPTILKDINQYNALPLIFES